MQVKKADDKPPLNSFPINQQGVQAPGQQDKDLSRKRIIVFGLIAGVLGASVGGFCLWYSGLHVNLNIVEKVFRPLEVKKEVKKEEILAKEKPVIPRPMPPIPPVVESKKEVVVPQVKKEVPKKAIENPQIVQKFVEKKSKKDPSYEWYYDETPAVYQYNALDSGPIILVPPGAKIEVSRDINFESTYLRGMANQFGEFRITNPPPGAVYWRIRGDDEDIHKITIENPKSTNIVLNVPDKLHLGESFSWKASENTSFYKIEISSDMNFTKITKIFSTKESSMSTSLIGTGTWFVRVATLNLSSGTFDYSQIVPLTISSL